LPSLVIAIQIQFPILLHPYNIVSVSFSLSSTISTTHFSIRLVAKIDSSTKIDDIIALMSLKYIKILGIKEEVFYGAQYYPEEAW
jgi:hypothetical protein